MEWRPIPLTPQYSSGWAYCLCQCGQNLWTPSYRLLGGRTKSCGCWHKEWKKKDITGLRFGCLIVLRMNYEGINARAECQCDCGNVCIRYLGGLQDGSTQSCGCQLRKYRNLPGQTFGFLTVLNIDWEQGEARCNCLCVCGTHKWISARALVRGDTKSCGCWYVVYARSKRKDFTGQRFGQLLVTRMVKKDKVWKAECQCDCGHISVVLPSSLTSGDSTSCGCSRRKSLQYTRERKRLQHHQRWALKKSLPSTFNMDHLSFLLQYWHYSCAVCGRQDDGLWHFIALDHWIPLKNSSCPGTTPGNMIPLCHGKKVLGKSREI